MPFQNIRARGALICIIKRFTGRVNGIVHILPTGAEVNIMSCRTITLEPGKERIGVYIYGLIRRAGDKGFIGLNSKLPDLA